MRFRLCPGCLANKDTVGTNARFPKPQFGADSRAFVSKVKWAKFFSEILTL